MVPRCELTSLMSQVDKGTLVMEKEDQQDLGLELFSLPT